MSADDEKATISTFVDADLRVFVFLTVPISTLPVLGAVPGSDASGASAREASMPISSRNVQWTAGFECVGSEDVETRRCFSFGVSAPAGSAAKSFVESWFQCDDDGSDIAKLDGSLVGLAGRAGASKVNDDTGTVIARCLPLPIVAVVSSEAPGSELAVSAISVR